MGRENPLFPNVHMARPGPGQNLEMETQFEYPTWLTGTQLFKSSSFASHGIYYEGAGLKGGAGTSTQAL